MSFMHAIGPQDKHHTEQINITLTQHTQPYNKI